MNPADTTVSPSTPGPPPRPTWLDLGDCALRDPRVRRDALIALAMVLLTIILTAWLLTDTLALLTLSGLAAGTGASLAARRRHPVRRGPR